MKKAEDITCIYGEPDIANYQALNSELRQLDKDMQAFILNSRQVRLTLCACDAVRLTSYA